MQLMSLHQLLNTPSRKIPDWLANRRALFAGAGILIFFAGFWILNGSTTSSASNQITALLEANEKLKETLTTLKQNAKAKVAQGDSRRSIIPLTIEPGQGFRAMNTSQKDLYIPRGAVFKAQLVTSIKTSIHESFVIAETTHTFQMGSKKRIERGSRLIGSASLDRALKGVTVKFDSLVTPKGIQYDDLSLLALSEKAYPLVEGIYFSDAGTRYGTALAFGFLSGFASGGMEREATVAGSISKPSLTNQALSGLSVSSFKIAEDVMESLKDESIEQVIVPAGTEIYVAFLKKWILVNPDSENSR